jgi:hypothetical protein
VTSNETKSGLRSTVDVYREGNIRDGCMVGCLLTVVVVVVGGEGGLTGVAKKSAVRERVGGADFGSDGMGDGGRVEKGEAKKAFVLDVEEESEMDDGIMSENVDDNDEALEFDDLGGENGTGFSVIAVITVALQTRISLFMSQITYLLSSHTRAWFLIIERVVLQRLVSYYKLLSFNHILVTPFANIDGTMRCVPKFQFSTFYGSTPCLKGKDGDVLRVCP